MASQSRWTTALPFLYPQRCRQGAHLFSTSTKRCKGPRGSHSVDRREKPQKSMQVLLKQDNGSSIPKDIGLLEGRPQNFDCPPVLSCHACSQFKLGTLIMPTGSKKPSIFTDFRKRMRLEWHRIQKRIEEKKMTYGYKFSLTEKRPRPKMGLRRIGPIAQALYRQMYNAYAE